MGLENTMTEHDMDAADRSFVHSLRNGADTDPDLDVDGLSDSVLVRLKRFFSFGRD